MVYSRPFDVAIIGAGIAGLSVALRLPQHMRIALFTKGQLGESNTRYAQGGLAVALGEDDSPELHFQDTLAAGAGLCDEEAVRILVEQAPAAVHWLIQMGVRFDRAQPGSDAHMTSDGLLLGREGAHSRWRVLHAGGDATGAEIERALIAALRARSSVVLYEETYVNELLMQDGSCVGVQAVDRNGHSFSLRSRATVLANGGAGGLWLRTSNPSGATADGLALALRAGAALADLEFMQFHPTVLTVNATAHLISEAVRGEGAYLRNHAGERFMPRYSSQAELAPRDVVARAILSEMLLEQTDYQYLDLRHLPADKMHARFPTISALCRQHGLDLTADLLPVAPAAHYCMGGVMVNTYGQTTLPGLYAVGEVACTGVHGANRLASNSLLEGLVYGVRVADGLVSEHAGSAVSASQSLYQATTLISYDSPLFYKSTSGNVDDRSMQQVRRRLQQIMWQFVSLVRDEQGLLEARQQVRTLYHMLASNAVAAEPAGNPSRQAEIVNMLQVAEFVIAAALERRESRGSHWRQDYQLTEQREAGHHYAFQLQSANAHARMPLIEGGQHV
ncbi:MAG TPA: L-aspartate oxidase [Ktedonosporobacter sp.]|jgi:L-aspartate oxidase|nr:L-aspartate oxidase [Ktedonosporobacter sp.]